MYTRIPIIEWIRKACFIAQFQNVVFSRVLVRSLLLRAPLALALTLEKLSAAPICAHFFPQLFKLSLESHETEKSNFHFGVWPKFFEK